MISKINNDQFRVILGSPHFVGNNNFKRNLKLDLEAEFPLKKKPRITEKYFKNWIHSMNNIYINLFDNINQNRSLNIYQNKDISINDFFHLFLIQMNFESKKILNVDFNLSTLFGSKVVDLTIFDKKKYLLNKKLIKELIPIIKDDYTNIDNILIESSNCNIFIDKKNNKLYKEFDAFSLLDMLQESFIQKILYSYAPKNIAEIYGIFKTNEKSQNVEYIFVQKYFESDTLYDNYTSLTKNEILNILISVCNQLILLQKEIQFIHNDLKINNVCINNEKNQAYLIDFGYSSLVCNDNLIHGYFELELNEFNKSNLLKKYTENEIITHQKVINNKYKNSSDLFYLIYTILYYNNSQFKNPIYDILYDLFIVNDSNNGTINIFDTIYRLESASFEYASFFMTKSNELFTEYFGNNIQDIDLFYQRFLPEKLSIYLSSFIEN
jgi:hypothetical protein